MGAVLGVLFGCGGEGAAPSDPGHAAEAEAEERFEGDEIESGAVPAEALDRARATADNLTRDLAGLVLSTMEAQGPIAAMEICSGVAQERTESHSLDGVLVRRVSQRLRNPRNAPDEAEARELDRLALLAGEGRLPTEIVRLVRSGNERTLHYLRPITVAPPCLTCHGTEEQIDPGVAALLRERYPADAATGYSLGDLRGAVSVRVPLGPGE